MEYSAHVCSVSSLCFSLHRSIFKYWQWRWFYISCTLNQTSIFSSTASPSSLPQLLQVRATTFPPHRRLLRQDSERAYFLSGKYRPPSSPQVLRVWTGPSCWWRIPGGWCVCSPWRDPCSEKPGLTRACWPERPPPGETGCWCCCCCWGQRLRSRNDSGRRSSDHPN